MSFGSGGFGGFGQQNQSSGFGFGSNNTNNTSTGFGSGSTFGSNTGTGLFGSAGGSGFGSTTGGFGSTGTSAFGAKPAFGATTSAGGGLFGSTTATAGSTGFGSGGGFGSTTASTSSPFGGTSTSLFGANKPAFGSGTTTSTGLFGSGSNTNNATTGFGTSTSGGFGATSNPGIGTGVGDPPGTAAVAFQPYIEKESTTNQQNSFQNILFMDAYKKWSVEELRLADYNQGRRFGNSTGTGAFGVSSGFGGFGSNNNTTTTATTGLFGGSTTNTATTSGFGTQNTATGGFGAAANNTGGLFGAKPATTSLFGNTPTTSASTGGLFGGTTGGFGTNTQTTGGFGTTSNTTGGGGLFGNASAQNKPATGFGGFGTNTQTTGGFGSTGTTGGFGASTTATNTGGGLFGSAANNTATPSAGGLFGAANNTAATNTTGGFGASTTGGFGAQPAQTGGGLFGQPKPATGGLFGTTPANTAATGTTGGGLFGNSSTTTPFGASTNTQSSFMQKPAATAGGGLFGNTAAQPAAGGGLFGSLGQANQAQQQAPQGSSLFGNSMAQNQQKPSLFGNTTPTVGNSLFGAQPNQQQAGNAFGQSVNTNQLQNSGMGGSLFGNSAQGANPLGVSQGLTTSISDAGAYGAPSLFQNLAASEVQNPGPLATPLSNKTKTSRRSSILPLYKMNPGSASKFATPQKRGYGFSYSTFGTPSSVSSTASTPASMGQSLLASSVNRSLTKSISSSNLRRTYNAEDSILLPGAFSASSGTRYYGSTGSNKKLVINRDMRSDLFSTPSKVRDNGKDVSDNLAVGSVRKLTKRVSFDTTIAKDTVPEVGRGSSGSANGGSSNADLGYLRPPSRPSSNGNGSAKGTSLSGGSSGSAPAVSSEPEMVQVSGKELAIVHEEDASPSGIRCIPANYTIDSKDLGEYWMSPSKDEVESMNRIQRQQVANFTVGRVNVGQVKFRVPVDLTKINLDSIAGGIVTLIIRSATVYPDVNTKPPVGQGLNVPAEIMLLHTCPRSGPDVSASKMKKHIQRLKAVPDTTFVSYDEKTAAWTFMVEHFTTYGFDEDEDDTTDAEGMSTASAHDERTDIASPLAASDNDENDDTFNFRRRKRPSLPGAFDNDADIMDDEDSESEQSSFLSSRSAEKSSHAVVSIPSTIPSTEYDDDMELTQDGLMENELDNEAPLSLQHRSAAGLDSDSLPDSSPVAGLAPVVPETPAGVLRARMRAIKESNTPLKVQVADGDNWMEMLQKTVSPQKRDRAALRAQGEMDAAAVLANLRESKAAPFDRKAAGRASVALRNTTANDNRGFATSIDLMNSLFEKAKAPPVKKAPETTITTTKGFIKVGNALVV